MPLKFPAWGLFSREFKLDYIYCGCWYTLSLEGCARLLHELKAQTRRSGTWLDSHADRLTSRLSLVFLTVRDLLSSFHGVRPMINSYDYLSQYRSKMQRGRISQSRFIDEAGRQMTKLWMRSFLGERVKLFDSIAKAARPWKSIRSSNRHHMTLAKDEK